MIPDFAVAPPPRDVPAPVPPAVDEPPPPGQEYGAVFTGSAGEYFRIWIVNLAFTLLTLGIYSAWAKVRKKRYLYSHTRIDGDSFEYRGNPIAILKGRILGVAVAGTLYVVSHFAPVYLLMAIPIAMFLVPWLLVKSLAFNAANSRFRGMRFRFHGDYWACWRILCGYGLVTILTLGLGYFLLKARLTEFILRRSAYGATPFEVIDLKRPFSSAYMKLIGLGIVGMIAIALVSVTVFRTSGVRTIPSVWAIWTINAVSYFIYIGLFAYIRSRTLNATWNNAALGGLRFRCTLSATRLFKLYLGNIVAIIATIGLATPWAVVRTLRYRAECFTIFAPGLDGLPAREPGAVSAAGEEVAEMLDLDFSL